MLLDCILREESCVSQRDVERDFTGISNELIWSSGALAHGEITQLLTILLLRKARRTFSSKINIEYNSSDFSNVASQQESAFPRETLFGSSHLGTEARQSPDDPRLEVFYTVEYKPNHPLSNKCTFPYLIEYRQAVARKLDDLGRSRTASGGVVE